MANQLLRRLGQPGVIGEIIAGLLLGPSLFGHLFPQASAFLFAAPGVGPPTVIISQIGLVLLMFQIGADFEFGHLTQKRNRLGMISIAVCSIGVPFALGFLIGKSTTPILAPGIDSLTYSLFFGVGLAKRPCQSWVVSCGSSI